MSVELIDSGEATDLMNDDSRWQAVLNRTAAFDGAFVYAVRSTGVFCRPTCPSRRPRREQVTFFLLPEAAQNAGFRACLRCHPGDIEAREPQLELVQQVCRHVQESLEDSISVTLDALSDAVGVSPYHLQRVFKRVMGITPRQYAEARRVERLKASLQSGETVTNALYDSGYNSSSRLYEKADTHMGMTPASYRRGGESVHIVYTITDSPLGRLLVAATERGVCAVRMGDTDAELEAALASEYRAASIEKDNGTLGEWVAAILDYMEGTQPNLNLPLDVRATAFQWRVWEELRRIPYGSTRSYAQVAASMGKPKAVRAVANACASNPTALIVPCHRVIREDGSLGGYRWGLARKEALLAQEHVHSPGGMEPNLLASGE